MRKSMNYGLRILTTGSLVLIFFAIPLHYGRSLCDALLQTCMPEDIRDIQIAPSGLLPESVERDPNVDSMSHASGRISRASLSASLGLVDYVQSFMPGGSRSDVFYEIKDQWAYFDRAGGQIVIDTPVRSQTVDGTWATRHTTFYIGPNGFSETPGKELGRFLHPMFSHASMRSVDIVYDGGLRRFFAIDRKARTIRGGPQLENSPTAQPVAVGSEDGSLVASVGWRPPQKRVLREKRPNDSRDDDRPQYEMRSTIPYAIGGQGRYVPVIDASGRVDLLDCDTLELITGRGMLPVPETLYGRGSSRPRELLSYEIKVINTGLPEEYTGMVVGSVSRQGTSMTLAVYDKTGKLVASGVTAKHDGSRSTVGTSAAAALFDVPPGPVLTISKYLLESLHPPVLTVVSFFAANSFSAIESYRTLFLMPNSFVAMHHDLAGGGIVWRFVSTFWVLLPAIFLSVLLAWRVSRDATIVGLSADTRSAWMVATIALGLPAYITYRLTRPKMVLVTCRNCGHPRRPDLERCHRCNSLWEMPELNPPAWRVLDGAADSTDEKPGREAEQKPDSSVNSM
jgi:hypothetical protein